MMDSTLARIKMHMKRQHQTEGELAQHLRIHRTTLSRYMNGHAVMPADVLFKVLDMLKLDVADVMAPPASSQTLMRSSKADIHEERFFRLTVDRFEFYGHAIQASGGATEVTLPTWRDATDSQDIARIAMRVRVLLGLPERGPIVSMFQNLSSAIKVLEFDADANSGCDGFIVQSPVFGTGLAVRRGLHLERKRATLAHELGHAVLHADQLVAPGAAPTTVSDRARVRDPREDAAWKFAASFLLPEEDLRDFMDSFLPPRMGKKGKKREVSRYLVIQLKHLFGLSASMTLNRLREEKWVNQDQYEQLMQEFYPRDPANDGARMIEERFPLSEAQFETSGSVQIAFERLLAQLYFEGGELSESRLEELLDRPAQEVDLWLETQAPMFDAPGEWPEAQVLSHAGQA